VFAGLLGEVLSGVAAVDSPLLEPAQPAKHGGQHHAEGVHEEVALAALDLLGRVVADPAAAGTGLHALAVEDAGRGLAVLAGGVAHPRTEPGVDEGPGAVFGPAAEDRVDGLPRREVLRHLPPLGPGFAVVEDRTSRIQRKQVRGRPFLEGLGRWGSIPAHCASVGPLWKTVFFIAPNTAAARVLNRSLPAVQQAFSCNKPLLFGFISFSDGL
jgi:hypothetical protein